MKGFGAAQQNAERQAQGRQRKQRYTDCSLKGLRPRYRQRKAQEYLMEKPNATWNDFSLGYFRITCPSKSPLAF